MKKTIRLTESDLARIVKRVINENEQSYGGLPFCKPGQSGTLVTDGVMYGLSNPDIKTSGPYCKIVKPKTA